MVRAFLQRRGVSFEERDVSRDPEAMTALLEHGAQTVPTVVLRDGTVWAMRQGGTFASLQEALDASEPTPSP